MDAEIFDVGIDDGYEDGYDGDADDFDCCGDYECDQYCPHYGQCPYTGEVPQEMEEVEVGYDPILEVAEAEHIRYRDSFRNKVPTMPWFVEIVWQTKERKYCLYAYDHNEEIQRTSLTYARYAEAFEELKFFRPEQITIDPYQRWRAKYPRHAWALDRLPDPDLVIPDILWESISEKQMAELWKYAHQLESGVPQCRQ